ncbi:MAG: phage shock protein C, partial [Vicingaceae bacterium]
MIERIQYFFERYAFGVCGWWGQKLGLPSVNIRKFFIYFSFLTLGSPIILYLPMAFVLEHKY